MTAYVSNLLVIILAIATVVVPVLVFVWNRKDKQGGNPFHTATVSVQVRAIACFLAGLLSLSVGLFVDMSSDFGAYFGKIFFIILGLVALVSGTLFFVSYRALAKKGKSKMKELQS